MKKTVAARRIFIVFLWVLGFGVVASFFNGDLGMVVIVVAVPALLFFGLLSKFSEVANPDPNQTHYGWGTVVIGLLLLAAILYGASFLV